MVKRIKEPAPGVVFVKTSVPVAYSLLVKKEDRSY